MIAAIRDASERDQIRRRVERTNRELRARPDHQTSYMYSEPTMPAGEAADLLMAWRRLLIRW